MTKCSAALVLVGLLAVRRAQASPVRLEATASPLEGSRFIAHLIPDEATARKGRRSFDDTLRFEGGRFALDGSADRGFEPSPYSVFPTADGWSFRTEQYSTREERAVWTGEIRGNSIRGVVTWTRKRGAALHYTFEGKREGAP